MSVAWDQVTVTSITVIAMTSLYCCSCFACKQHLKYDKVIFFGLMSAGIVTGIYITVTGFRLHQATTTVYLCAFGTTVSFLTLDQAAKLLKAVFRKNRKTLAKRSALPDRDG